jgi:hypothetical protein
MSMRLRAVVGLCLLALSASIGAHHNPAMLYDLMKEIDVHGIVTEYRLGNPHLRIYLDVDNNGTTEKWMAEGGSRTVLLRKGWDENVVSVGDRVTIHGHATRDGSLVVHMVNLILPDGTEIYGEDLDRTRYEELRQRRDR